MTDLWVLILLFLFGGFAIVSALVKAHVRITAPAGVVLAVLEGLAGLSLMILLTPASGSLRTASATGITTVFLVCISSTVHLVNVRKRSRVREASQERWLYQSIKYSIGEPGSSPPEEDLAGTDVAGEDGGGERY